MQEFLLYFGKAFSIFLMGIALIPPSYRRYYDADTEEAMRVLVMGTASCLIPFFF